MYRLCLVLWAAVVVTAQYDGEQRGGGGGLVGYPGKPLLGPLYSSFSGSQGFRDTSYEDNAVTPSPTPVYRNPSSPPQVFRKPSSSDGPKYPNPQRGPIRGPNGQIIKGQLEEELDDEKEEPDRLTLLLPQSKFDCVGKQTGYYADEDLNCEVFHYCQDNAKHSWICPEGFTFHQVHLICMPPNGDISCKKSSQYHFVNEYLYKALNLDEAESKPNVTLRYSERYFPSEVYTDERETQHYRVTVPPPRRPQVFLPSQSIPSTINSIPNGNLRPSPSPSPVSQYRIPLNQVFRSPEEINIPLQQRRPQQQTLNQNLRSRFPQIRNDDDDYE